MKKQQIELQTALQSDEMFLEFLKQEAQSEAYCQLQDHAKKRLHPAAEQLYDYVSGWLDQQEAKEVREHIALCGDCAQEVMKIMRIEDEMEQDALDWADIPPSREKSPAQAPLHPGVRTANETCAVHKDSLTGVVVKWLSPLWEPQWAGQLVTASDIPKQVHTFTSEDGDIRISCYWQGEYKDEPAYIQLSWKSEIIPESELWVRFVYPETQAIRHEVCLGTVLTGEETFTSDDLGFDPSDERWAISVALAE